MVALGFSNIPDQDLPGSRCQNAILARLTGKLRLERMDLPPEFPDTDTIPRPVSLT